MERYLKAAKGLFVGLPLLGCLIGGVGFPALAKASGVVVCNDCPSSTNRAIAAGIGLTAVVDITQVKLLAYDVEYDKELRRWRALPTPVPGSVNKAFVNAVDVVSKARDSSPRVEGGGSAAPLKGRAGDRAGGPALYLYPDAPTIQNGVVFPDAFKGSTAHEVVQNATWRQRLGLSLADAFKGTDASNPLWNGIAGGVAQAVLTWGDYFGAGTVTMVITWRDGSVTVYRLTTDNINEAKYSKGDSRDKLGNKIPDASVADPQSAADFAGRYYFGEGASGAAELQNWLDSARMYGIPITDGSGVRHGVDCSWNGTTLKCSVF